MNSIHFKDPVSHMCLPGAVVAFLRMLHCEELILPSSAVMFPSGQSMQDVAKSMSLYVPTGQGSHSQLVAFG